MISERVTKTFNNFGFFHMLVLKPSQKKKKINVINRTKQPYLYMSAWEMFESSVTPDSIVFKLFREAGYSGIITRRHSNEVKKIDISAG